MFISNSFRGLKKKKKNTPDAAFKVMICVSVDNKLFRGTIPLDFSQTIYLIYDSRLHRYAQNLLLTILHETYAARPARFPKQLRSVFH